MKKQLIITLLLIAPQSVFGMEEDPNIKSDLLDHELITAIRKNNQEKVEQALARGANPNTSYRYKSAPATPLGWAAHLGHTNIAKLLIQHGAEIDSSKNHDGGRAIHLACQKGHHEVVRLLIANQADIHTPNRTGHPPLENAICSGSVETVEALLDAGAIINPTQIHSSCGASGVSWKGWSFNSSSAMGGTPLCSAIKAKRPAIVKLCVERGADVNDPRVLDCPLVEAYMTGKPEIVQILEDAGAKIINMRPKLLKDAITFENILAVKLFISRGCDLEFRGWPDTTTPLLRAAAEGYVEICTLLLKAGANPWAKTSDNQTADEYTRYMINVRFGWRNQDKVQGSLLEIDETSKQYKRFSEETQRCIRCVKLIDRYQQNPLSLRSLCINKVREFIANGKVTRNELAGLPQDILDDSRLMLVIAPDQKK